MASAEGESGVTEYRNLFGVRVLNPVDMDETQLRHAIETTRAHLRACDDWHLKGDAVVTKIKEEFDTNPMFGGPSWHVVIGKHFGSKVTHDARHFCFFYIEVSLISTMTCCTLACPSLGRS
jgi:dynein light chain LC8-type